MYAAGDLFVADYITNRVVDLPADGAQITLPFTETALTRRSCCGLRRRCRHRQEQLRHGGRVSDAPSNLRVGRFKSLCKTPDPLPSVSLS